MAAKIISQSKKSIIIQFEVNISSSMLDSEESLQRSLNEAGSLATGEILKTFDTDGSPIIIGNQKLTSKGKIKKTYHAPYGEISVARHVYQGIEGGKTFCPLDRDARIITKTTPKMGKMLSSKYSSDGATRVVKDLEENHNVRVSKLLMQNICEAIGTVANAKEEDWNYELPELDRPVRSISIGLDGTCMLLTNDGWREAMAGTIALYNYKGERMHTIYTASNPEYGKETFIKKFENEIARIKAKYPKAEYVGVADGARDNWPFLNKHTDRQVIDFYHATEYLGRSSKIIFKDEIDRKEWIDDACHKLKHNMGGASRLLAEVVDFKKYAKLKKKEKEEINRTISYFTKNKIRMKYYQHIENNLPIGSGVTEAACKVIVKQRLCNSGMRWKDKGASVVLTLRCLNQTEGRWEQFWEKIDRYGFPVAS